MKFIPIFILLLAANLSFAQDTANTTSTINTNSKSDTISTVKSPPASAISPTINTANSDLCTVGVAGAVQTQILGISAGATVVDLNCERLKLSKTLFDMGMKVAAVSTLCQDRRVFDAMMMAGTPCPYDGAIGSEAKAAWKANESKQPDTKQNTKGFSDEIKTMFGSGGVLLLLLLLLL
jgi:hypothetical protein